MSSTVGLKVKSSSNMHLNKLALHMMSSNVNVINVQQSKYLGTRASTFKRLLNEFGH